MSDISNSYRKEVRELLIKRIAVARKNSWTATQMP